MRYTQKDFPPYQFIPGKAPHPEKEGGYLRGIEIKPYDFSEQNYQTNETYLYAIDLYNHEYFWEAHVYWEVLWNYVGRKTSEGYFLQALIKLAAAGVKSKLDHQEASEGHCQRALQHLEHVHQSQLFGLNKAKLIEMIKEQDYRFQLKLSL